MYPVFETIKVAEGKLHNMEYHLWRMQQTALALWNYEEDYMFIEKMIEDIPQHGLWKCKLSYNRSQVEIQFSLYAIQPLHQLLLVEQPLITYPYKFTDRSALNKYKEYATHGSDILFLKNGFLTDAMYANVILWTGSEWHTPSTPLLKGTKRKYLLDKGLIMEKEIKVNDLYTYESISLISAMLDPGQRQIRVGQVSIK